MADLSAVRIFINGENLTAFGRVGRVRIDDVLNDAPNTAALTLVLAPRIGPYETGPFALAAFDAGAFNTRDNPAPVFAPPPVTVGAPIGIYVNGGAHQIFGGEIVTRAQYAEFDQPANVRLDLTCTDYTRQLTRRIVSKDYGQTSATDMVLDLMANFAPTIGRGAVEAGLPTVDGGMTFTFADVGAALSRIAAQIGAYWYIDYQATLHFFTGTETGIPTPAPLVPGARFANLKITADLTQVRTRILVEGDGGTVAVTLPAGDVITPISQSGPFDPAGGRATMGAWRVTYIGLHDGTATTNTTGPDVGGSAGGGAPTPPGAPTATLASAGTAGALAGGPYYYRVTLELADGSRSTVGDPSAGVTIAAAANPPATAAALQATPIKGPLAVGVTSSYATSYVAADGSETVAPGGGTLLTGRRVADPPIWTLAFSGSGGGLSAGYYDYAITFLTAAGESLPNYVRNLTATAGGWYRLTIPVANDARVVGRRIYRSSVSSVNGVSGLPWRQVVDVPDNTTTTFDDKAADATLATKNPPAFSTATDVGEGAIVTVPISADPRVVHRRLYRQDGPGPFRLVAELPDNATPTFTDVVVGPGGDLAPTVNHITTGAVSLTAIPLGPAGTVTRRVFRTTANGSQYRELVALNDNTTTTYLDTTADANLGGSPLPAQGVQGAAGTIPPAAAGQTYLQVTGLDGFPPAGWIIVDSAWIRYAQTSSAGGFFLGGIPASGPGAILADIPAGTAVALSPALVGVSPAVPVSLGDSVQLLAQVDDAAAQTALAALEGGDGVIEYYIQDRRLNAASALARGEAELALFGTVETQLSYTTHDLETASGRTVHVDLPAPTNLTGDFLIQEVIIDDVAIASAWMPQRTVTASTTRFSLEDVLNRMVMEQH